jgi:hypothetical protein
MAIKNSRHFAVNCTISESLQDKSKNKLRDLQIKIEQFNFDITKKRYIFAVEISVPLSG